jgi:conjugative relaxase-like TrwC/TraI family protein
MVLLFRAARSVDLHYYLSDPGRELEHLDVLQRARCGAAASAYFPTDELHEEGLRRFLRGQPLAAIRSLASDRREVEAFELLFVAPKSVSVAALLAPDDLGTQVVTAHHGALDGALSYLEQHGAATSHAEMNFVHALSGVRFTHGVSRSLDPHLHSHVLIANLGQSQGGRFGALDQRGFRAHLDAASALYDARLMASCRALGFATELSSLARAAFSTRQAEARQLRFEQRRTYPRGFHDDAAKIKVTRDELLAKWGKQLNDVGLVKEEVLQQLPLQTPPQRRLDEVRFRSILLGDDRRITRRKVVEAWAWASGGSDARQIDAAVESFVSQPTSLFEQELRQADVIPSSRAQRVLGSRPLDHRGLERWLQASQVLERTAPIDYRDRDVVRARSSRSESHGWSR